MPCAMRSWNSNSRRSSRRLVNKCRRIRKCARKLSSALAARASALPSRPARASPVRLSARCAARATQIRVCTSRRPPGLSFRFGSSSSATSAWRPWRTFCSRNLAWKKAAGSICACKALCIRRNRARSPASQRDSSMLVWIVMSCADSARHSDRLRTLWPIGRPTSQSSAMSGSKRARSASDRSSSNRISTSTSDCG